MTKTIKKEEQPIQTKEQEQTQKRDLYHSKERFENWLNQVEKKGVTGLSKINSDFLIQYIKDMKDGINVGKKSLGKRSYITLNPKITRLSILFRLFEHHKIKDIKKLDEELLLRLFSCIVKGRQEYVKEMKAFWSWLTRVEKKKGKILKNIADELHAERKDPPFVYFLLDDLMKVQPYFDINEQTLNLFLFDTIIRCPTECQSVKVHDLQDDCQTLVIRDEIAKKCGKKAYGRTIKLLLCSEELKKYIERNKLKPDDYLFSFDNANYNRKLKKIFTKVFGDIMTKGGQKFSQISVYDYRHSGSCHWRLGAYKTKIDGLRYRGGWENFERLNYYTKKLGMSDSIDRSDLLAEVDKNEFEKLKDELKTEKENTKKLIKESELRFLKMLFEVKNGVAVEELEIIGKKFGEELARERKKVKEMEIEYKLYNPKNLE